ncbi:MAG TPA: HPr kinase/phosphatase C-terminal domain-containing protein [Rhizomicrobium sp.]|nr:HPr kinase/phosphatase C-terminal domain-containing protein [Rhizomicrobium sp.]
MDALNIHATCVKLASGAGVLLMGPSGSGKSDLAIRLIDGGAVLVADDRCDLSVEGNSLIARPPTILAGLIELRGVGIITIPYAELVAVSLVVELVPRADVVRLPEPEQFTQLGIGVRSVRLHAFDASTPAKIRALA